MTVHKNRVAPVQHFVLCAMAAGASLEVRRIRHKHERRGDIDVLRFYLIDDSADYAVIQSVAEKTVSSLIRRAFIAVGPERSHAVSVYILTPKGQTLGGH